MTVDIHNVVNNHKNSHKSLLSDCLNPGTKFCMKANCAQASEHHQKRATEKSEKGKRNKGRHPRITSYHNVLYDIMKVRGCHYKGCDVTNQKLRKFR